MLEVHHILTNYVYGLSITQLIEACRSFYFPDDISADDKKESPTVLLWTRCFLAQHYDFLGNTRTALEYIDKALEHTPTLIEAYMIKARIYKVII